MIVYRTIKRYNETGSVLDKQRSGRPRSIRTPGLKNSVRCRIFRNPRWSMRKMAREFKVNHETMRKLVSEDLGMRSFKRSKVHHLNDSIRAKRLTRCKGSLSDSVLEISTVCSSRMRKYLLLKKQQTSKTIGFCQRTPRAFLKVLK